MLYEVMTLYCFFFFLLYFSRSDMTKDQMVVDLAFRTKVLLWSGVALGSLAIGVLGYAAVRYCGVDKSACTLSKSSY